MEVMKVNAVSYGGGYQDIFPEETITYVRALPAQTEVKRHEYKKIRSEFISLCVKFGILDDILSAEELKKAEKDKVLPDYLSIHHMVPLGGGGNNDFDMLKILPRDFHNLIHYVYNKIIAQIYIDDVVELPAMGMKVDQIYYCGVTPEAFLACKLYAPEAIGAFLGDDAKSLPSGIQDFRFKKHQRKEISNNLKRIQGNHDDTFMKVMAGTRLLERVY